MKIEPLDISDRLTTICWSCGGKGNKADGCTSKKVTHEITHPS